jgi:hypothetical protein
MIAHLSQHLRPSLSLSQVGSRVTRFEACSAFTHVTACVLAESPIVTLSIGGFSGFIASTTAPIATGWSDSCRVGIAPTGNRRLSRRTEKCGLRVHPGEYRRLIILYWNPKIPNINYLTIAKAHDLDHFFA